MKKYWTDVRKEEPEAVPVNFESSLKIEILKDVSTYGVVSSILFYFVAAKTYIM